MSRRHDEPVLITEAEPSQVDQHAATLHAVRLRIGDAAFAALARTWFERHDDTTGSTPQFVALAEEVSGQDLDAFFEAWLFAPVRPTP